MGSKQFNKAKGFTLVELIAVVAIISMIAVYITIEINRSSDDAKVGIATAFLTSNVPAAISSYRARHLASCVSLPSGAETAVDSDGKTVRAILIERGLAAQTPWADDWSASYDNGERQLTLVFPVNGANAGAIAVDLNSNLQERGQVVSSTSSATAGTATTSATVTVVYSCS